MGISYKTYKYLLLYIALFPGIQVHSQDVLHPFPTMLSCIWGAHTGLIWPVSLSALNRFNTNTFYMFLG